MIHFAQMVQSQQLQKYDFKNDELNRNRYLADKPPLVNLTEIRCVSVMKCSLTPFRTPIIAYYGTDDDLSTVDDVEWALGKSAVIFSDYDVISDKLPNVVERVKLEGFDHLDFLWGTRAPTYLYSEIIDFIHEASANFQQS